MHQGTLMKHSLVQRSVISNENESKTNQISIPNRINRASIPGFLNKIMPIPHGYINYCNYYKKLCIEQILNTNSEIYCGTCSVIGQVKYNLFNNEYYLDRLEFLKCQIPVPEQHSSIPIYQIYTDQDICGVQLPIHKNVRIYGEILMKPRLSNYSPILHSPRDIKDKDELKYYQLVISLHNFKRIYDLESLFISELYLRRCLKIVNKHHKPK